MKQLLVFTALTILLAAGPMGIVAAEAAGPVRAIGVENEYADVISQIGGKYVQVQAIETDPNTDPHTFEASPKIAKEIAAAQLIVVNGVGYDDWADKIMSASHRPNRKVINAQKLLGLPDDTANPHLWFDLKTMPAVAKAVGDTLAELDPGAGRVFPRQRGKIRRLARTLEYGDRGLQGKVRQDPGRRHRAGRGLPVAGDGLQHCDALQPGESNHGRHRPVTAGRHHAERVAFGQ